MNAKSPNPPAGGNPAAQPPAKSAKAPKKAKANPEALEGLKGVNAEIAEALRTVKITTVSDLGGLSRGELARRLADDRDTLAVLEKAGTLDAARAYVMESAG